VAPWGRADLAVQADPLHPLGQADLLHPLGQADLLHLGQADPLHPVGQADLADQLGLQNSLLTKMREPRCLPRKSAFEPHKVRLNHRSVSDLRAPKN
jgi:hypothetical protein